MTSSSSSTVRRRRTAALLEYAQGLPRGPRRATLRTVVDLNCPVAERIARRYRRRGGHFDLARNQRQPVRMIRRTEWVAGLPQATLIANLGNRPHVIVLPFRAPGSDGRVMNCAV